MSGVSGGRRLEMAAPTIGTARERKGRGGGGGVCTVHRNTGPPNETEERNICRPVGRHSNTTTNQTTSKEIALVKILTYVGMGEGEMQIIVTTFRTPGLINEVHRRPQWTQLAGQARESAKKPDRRTHIHTHTHTLATLHTRTKRAEEEGLRKRRRRGACVREREK